MKKEKQNDLENEASVDVEVSSEETKVEKKEKAPKITKIGAMLKEMRQQKGLKLIDVSKKLCIRKCYLEAIEDSNYSEIPAFPYGNGFIRSYANFLGLNGENIVELYKEETTASKQKNMNVLEPQPEATMPNIRHIIISLLAIVLIYIGWLFYNQQSEEVLVTTNNDKYTEENNNDYADVIVVENFDNATVDTNSTEDVKPIDDASENQIVVSEEIYQGDVTATESESKTATEAEIVTESATENSTEASVDDAVENVRQEIPDTGVYIEVLKATWVEIKDNDKLYLSKVLQPGDLYKVPEGKGKVLSVGKYDGINVYINGVLTNVVRPQKKMNIYLDKFINPEL